MAKKARRKKQTVLTQAQLAGTKKQDEVLSDKVIIEYQVPEPTARVAVDFRQEYKYVVNDLQRVGILAAIMLGILIALNLVLR
jgi:hypothetical protein